MDKLIHFFFFTCKKATLFIEQQQSTDVSVLNTFKLKIHLHFCKACTNYAIQSKLIEKAFKNNHKNKNSTELFHLSETDKSLMIKKMEEKLKEK